MAKHACSWCDDNGASVRKLDAADQVHWFHAGCWQVQLAWLRGHNGLPDKPGSEWSSGPPAKYRGLAK